MTWWTVLNIIDQPDVDVTNHIISLSTAPTIFFSCVLSLEHMIGKSPPISGMAQTVCGRWEWRRAWFAFLRRLEHLTFVSIVRPKSSQPRGGDLRSWPPFMHADQVARLEQATGSSVASCSQNAVSPGTSHVRELTWRLLLLLSTCIRPSRLNLQRLRQYRRPASLFLDVCRWLKCFPLQLPMA